jgi:hypothetical protein
MGPYAAVFVAATIIYSPPPPPVIQGYYQLAQPSPQITIAGEVSGTEKRMFTILPRA